MTNWYRSRGKRLGDIIAAASGLVLLSPVLAATAAFIKIGSRGPIFFTQTRVGEGAVPFPILKFRTMRTFGDSYTANGRELTNEERITCVGRVLRRTSIDELPQLLNILKGEMSLVGPRPALPYQVERYTDRQRDRLKVRPGITGLAQVSGRNQLSWSEKIALDLEYVADVSLALDISILLRTWKAVVSGAGQHFVTHDELSNHDGNIREHIGESPS